MENVSVELYLGEGASGASCVTSHNSSWTFNPKKLVRILLRYAIFFSLLTRLRAESSMGDEEPACIFELYTTRNVHVYASASPVSPSLITY